jgi:hypothetical protein
MADVVIPRGAENTVAIDLVSQHLKYQLSKILGPNIDIKKTDSGLALLSHEIIDPKHLFTEGRIIVHEDSSQLDLLKEILTDFLNGKNILYYKIFIENMLRSLTSLYNMKITKLESDRETFLTEFDNFSCIESSIKRILLYKHIILSESDCEIIE